MPHSLRSSINGESQVNDFKLFSRPRFSSKLRISGVCLRRGVFQVDGCGGLHVPRVYSTVIGQTWLSFHTKALELVLPKQCFENIIENIFPVYYFEPLFICKQFLTRVGLKRAIVRYLRYFSGQ
jgi:hypothetical protein